MKIILYALATFLETWLGIWIFAQAFPKRMRMERRHQVSEWILITTLVITTYSFTVYYCSFVDKKKFLWFLVVLYIFLLIGYLFYKKMHARAAENKWVLLCMFIIIGILLTCQYWASYQSDIMMIAGNVYGVIFLFSFFQCKLSQAYLWQSLYITNSCVLKTMYIIYCSLFKNIKFEEYLLYPRQHSYEEIVYWIFIELGILIIAKYMPFKILIRTMLKKYKKTMLLILLFELFVIEFLLNNGEGSATQKNLTISLLVFIVFMFTVLSVLLRFLKKAENAEKELFIIRNNAIESQYKEVSEAFERYRRLVHDEKHILSYLKECLEDGEYAEAISFIENSQKSMTDKSKTFWTGITTLDFMLNIKKRKMDNLGIQFELCAGVSVIPMEDADFVVLLGNLLDNAIEAVEKCELENRKIWVSIQNINDMFLFKIKNTNKNMPKLSGNRFVTSKNDSMKHGIGIESAKKIIEKYNGDISFEIVNGFFEVSFILGL